MSNKEVQYLKTLKDLKDRAITTESEIDFPGRFYEFAEYFLNIVMFAPIIAKIEDIYLTELSGYHELLVKMSERASFEFNTFSEALKIKKIGPSNVSILQIFTEYPSMDSVSVYMRINVIKSMLKIVRDKIKTIRDENGISIFFYEEITKKIDEFDKYCYQWGEWLDYLHRMVPVRVWGALRRICLIYKIYNPKNYKSFMEELQHKDQRVQAMQLKVIYQGLVSCIDPGQERLSYDENFYISLDKWAIQTICNYVEGYFAEQADSIPESTFVENYGNKLDVIILNETTVRITYKSKSWEGNADSNIAKVSLHFKSKSSITGEQFIKILTSETEWGNTQLKIAIQKKNSICKFYNEYFGISKALNIKTIKTTYDTNRIKISRNSNHW